MAQSTTAAMCKSGKHDLSVVGVLPPSPSRLRWAPNAKGTCRGCANESGKQAARARRAADRGETYNPSTYQPIMGRPASVNEKITPTKKARIYPGQPADEWIDSGYAGTLGRWLSAANRFMTWGMCNADGVNPDWFFPVEGETPTEARRRNELAKSVCEGCFFIDQCREYALGSAERCGVWGGMSELDRQRELQRRANGVGSF